MVRQNYSLFPILLLVLSDANVVDIGNVWRTPVHVQAYPKG